MPIDRDETATGVDVRWTPFPDEHGTVRSGLAFIGGYEYAQTRRTYDYDTIFISSTASGGEIFQQPDTDVNTFTAGVEEKWSPCFNSYVRCKFIDTAYPLYGISPGRSLTTPTEQESLAAALDSTLPTRETRIEVGSTWSPGYGFMLNGTFYVEDASNHGPYAYFDSTSYPFIISSWYAVTPAWTINAGYANFVNAINQQVSLGLTTPPAPNSAYTAPWRYLGQRQRVQRRHVLCVEQAIEVRRQLRVCPRPGRHHQHADADGDTDGNILRRPGRLLHGLEHHLPGLGRSGLSVAAPHHVLFPLQLL